MIMSFGMASAAPPDTTSSLQALEIDKWPGTWFVVLEKPEMYCEYGYELYTSPLLDKNRSAVDTSFETEYHRARCTSVSGHRVKILAAARAGAERIITLHDELSGRKLYAKTTDGVHHEIARESDLHGAAARWKGKSVFSARGFITRFGKDGASSIKVRLQDSLHVTDVCFGLTPLPVKPVWLMVKTRGGEQGTIPVYYSWTNVKKSLRSGNPWDGDIFESDPSIDYPMDSEAWEIINKHNVYLGMTRDQVRLSWGEPHSKKREAKGLKREVWEYAAQKLVFDDKTLVALE